MAPDLHWKCRYEGRKVEKYNIAPMHHISSSLYGNTTQNNIFFLTPFFSQEIAFLNYLFLLYRIFQVTWADAVAEIYSSGNKGIQNKDVIHGFNNSLTTLCFCCPFCIFSLHFTLSSEFVVRFYFFSLQSLHPLNPLGGYP